MQPEPSIPLNPLRKSASFPEKAARTQRRPEFRVPTAALPVEETAHRQWKSRRRSAAVIATHRPSLPRLWIKAGAVLAVVFLLLGYLFFHKSASTSTLPDTGPTSLIAPKDIDIGQRLGLTPKDPAR